MSCERKMWKVLSLAVSLACAVSLGGCQRQAQPSGDLTQPDSAVSPAGSEEPASSLTESAASQPLSSSDSGETSQPPSQEAEGAGSSQAVVSSSGQQASSEAASQPSSSQEAASESQTPSIPFTLVECRLTRTAAFPYQAKPTLCNTVDMKGLSPNRRALRISIFKIKSDTTMRSFMIMPCHI